MQCFQELEILLVAGLLLALWNRIPKTTPFSKKNFLKKQRRHLLKLKRCHWELTWRRCRKHSIKLARRLKSLYSNKEVYTAKDLVLLNHKDRLRIILLRKFITLAEELQKFMEKIMEMGCNSIIKCRYRTRQIWWRYKEQVPKSKFLRLRKMLLTITKEGVWQEEIPHRGL